MALKVVVEGYMAAPMVKDKLRNSERPCRRFWTTVQALKWPATSTKDIGRVGEWTGQVTVNEREGASELLGSHLTASHIHPQLPSGVEEWTGRATMIEHEGASELPGSHLTASHIHPQLPDGVEEWTGQVTMNEREDASELLGSHLTASQFIHSYPEIRPEGGRVILWKSASLVMMVNDERQGLFHQSYMAPIRSSNLCSKHIAARSRYAQPLGGGLNA